jgi:hypothetical protein
MAFFGSPARKISCPATKHFTGESARIVSEADSASFSNNSTVHARDATPTLGLPPMFVAAHHHRIPQDRELHSGRINSTLGKQSARNRRKKSGATIQVFAMLPGTRFWFFVKLQNLLGKM